MLLERPPKIFRWLFPEAIFRCPSPEGEKRIWLTFDDGPVPEATPFVLDTLDHYGILATFFMVADNVLRYPHLADEVRLRGHFIGNHTKHHIQAYRSTPRQFFRDLIEGERITGSQLFRPPHGWMPRSMTRIIAKHRKIVMMDLVTRDYSHSLSAADVFSNVTRFARPGSVIVFHDSLRSIHRIREALPASIEWLIDNGYSFHTLY